MICYIGFISGMLLGFELSNDDEFNYLIVDLLIIELVIEWDRK